MSPILKNIIVVILAVVVVLTVFSQPDKENDKIKGDN